MDISKTSILIHVNNAIVHVNNVMVRQLFVQVVYQLHLILNIFIIQHVIQHVLMVPILMVSTVRYAMQLLFVPPVQLQLSIALHVPWIQSIILINILFNRVMELVLILVLVLERTNYQMWLIKFVWLLVQVIWCYQEVNVHFVQVGRIN